MEKTPSIHWAWIILGTCFINLFINYSIRLGYSVVMPEMIRTLHLGRTDAGSIFNAYLFTYIVVTPFTGYFTDRFGARRVISLGALVLGIGVLMMGTVQSLWAACVSYAVVGLGATGMWTPVLTVVQRWFAPHRRGLALGIMSTGYGLGFAVMGAVFPWVVAHYSWRYAWYYLGAAALALIFVNAGLMRSSPESIGLRPWGQKKAVTVPKTGNETVQPSHSLADVFKRPVFWLIGGSYFCIAYALYGITTFMVDYAKYQLQLPLEKASFLATIHGACQILGVLTILPLSDYIGRKKTVLYSNAMITAALAGILIKGDTWSMLAFFVGWVAVFYGATFPIYGACAGDYFPKEMMGTVIGAWTPFYGIGAISTHWITGLLRDATGVYGNAFAINVGMAALAIVFMGFVKEGPSFRQIRHQQIKRQRPSRRTGG